MTVPLVALLVGILLGPAAFGLAVFLRVLPWPRTWIERPPASWTWLPGERPDTAPVHRHWFWRKLWDCPGCAASRAAFVVCILFFCSADGWPGWVAGTLCWTSATGVAAYLYAKAGPPPPSDTPDELDALAGGR